MKNSKKLIAFMGGMIDEEKNCYLIRSMEEECRKNGYMMISFGFSESTFDDQDKNSCELKLIKLADLLDLKALIVQLEFIKNNYIIEAIRNLAKQKQIPLIVMGQTIPGCINISLNYKSGFAEMVRHVVQVHGCRKVNMMAGIEGDHYSEERIEAYKQVLEENNIPIEEKRIGYGQFWDRPAREAARKFLEDGDAPEAIVCANDNMAIAVSDEVQKAGFMVPEDIIVTGFDGERNCLFKSPPISTVEADYESVAKQIIRQVEDNEDNPDAEGYEEIGCNLRLRGSCGCNGSESVLLTRDVENLSEYYDDVNWAVTSVNNLISMAAALETIADLSVAAQGTLWLWERDFQFVALKTELLRDEISDLGNGKFTQFLAYRDGVGEGIGKSFDGELFPDFKNIIDNSDMSLMIVQLLRSGNRAFGYLVEGAGETNDRTVRRCVELGMFLSTAINIVDVNRNLIRMRTEIEQVSIRDYLTGIFNRRGFFAEMDHIISYPSSRDKYLTVFSIDMDGLKSINDNYGHAEGDFAIQCIAEAIHHVASRNGISARYGGDEFACALISDAPVKLTADTFRSRIDNYLSYRDDVKDKEYVITASIGSACARIDGSIDIEKLINEADDAMYTDKQTKEERMKRKLR